MFERKTPQPFPVRNIVFLLLVILAFFFFLFKSMQKSTGAAPADKTENENNNGGLRPEEWYYALREYPVFKPDIETYARALEQAHGLAAGARGLYPGFATPWTLQGPANIGARINSVKVHPTDPNIMYVGYSIGGVWKTTDGGQNWNPIFDKQIYLTTGDIELDPQNPDIVYVGAGDLNISGSPFIGDGLWKSTDGGQNWQHLGLDKQCIISKIIIHPTNSNILYVATMGLPFERNNDRGLYKSTDGGQNWSQVLFVNNQTGIIDLEMDPGNPNVLYAACWERLRNAVEGVNSGPNARIWKTTDAGANWTKLAGGLPQNRMGRIGTDLDAQNAQHLVAIYADSLQAFGGIFQSFDGGQNWQATANNGLDPSFQGGNFAWYFGKIFINPYDPLDIWALGVRTYRSLDGGENWYEEVPWEPWNDKGVHADHHDMAFLGPNAFLLATDGGLFRSDDNGENWTKIENIPTTQFYRVAWSPHYPEYYFGGAQDNGTVAGEATALDGWIKIYGGDGFQSVFHPSDPDIYYVEWQYGNIVGIIGGGAQDATEGIEKSDRRNWDMPYFISPHDPDMMYTGTYRVYGGYFHPPVWGPLSEDLTDGIIFGKNYHTISTIAESPLEAGLLFAGTSDANVWRGDGAGASWENITAGLPERYVSCVKPSPSDANRVFVTHTGYLANDFSAHIHRSDDRGASWTPVAGNLPNLAINDLLILPGHQDSMLFVATDGGVYGTLDAGKHWERLGAGMPTVQVYDLDVNWEQNTLIAGTHARSIFTFPLDSLSAGGDVSTYNPGGKKPPVLALHPTLATGRVTVTIEHLPSKQSSEVWISDLSGRVLWREKIRGGQRQTREVEVQDFAPGVYVAFARVDGKVWAQRKFVVARN